MRTFTILFFAATLCVSVFSADVIGQTCAGGIAYTSCFPWTNSPTPGYPNGDGNLPNGKPNDTPRLQRAINANPSKIIFNEAEYYLGVPTGYSYSPTLNILSYRIIEGTGRSSEVPVPPLPVHLTSKIIQTANAPIFKIGTNIRDVSIRDIALVGGSGTTGTIGILAEGNCTTNCSSVSFQFSNIKFSKLDKGIYVNATDPPVPPTDPDGHNWQFDNVRLDHSFFDNCNIGIHINSHNSGWNISSIDFLMPADDPNSTPPKVTYGIYLERSTYTSMDLLIGNGPTSTGPPLATALIKVERHANLSIQNTVAEGFREDINIDGSLGTGRNSPINLMNNTFLNGVTVKDSTVFSSGNQYAALNNHGSPAIAKGTAQIYSVGDKYCVEGDALCDEGRGFTLQNDARVIFSSTQNKNFTQVPSFLHNYLEVNRDTYPNNSTPNLSIIAPNYAHAPLLRLGVRGYNYDITRSETSGNGDLEFSGSQVGYGGYTFKTQGGTVKINYDGSVTFGSKSFSTLGSPSAGTMIYCNDCQQTSPCNSGGGGAIAKRIGTSWICN